MAFDKVRNLVTKGGKENIMVQIDSKLALGVSAFLESGDKTFLDNLLAMDRNDIAGQATVRYLMQLKHWPFTPESGFSAALTHLFADYPDRPKREPAEYQATTFDLIKQTFGYECVVVVPEPRPEKPEAKANPGKRTSKPRMQTEEDTLAEEGESGSRTFKSINELDTKGASDHVKKAIAIQRGG